MTQRQLTLLAVAGLVALVATLFLLFGGAGGPQAAPEAPATNSVAPDPAGAAAQEAPPPAEAQAQDLDRQAVIGAGFADTGVRGVVVNARTGVPMPDVEVVAMRRLPALERLEARFRGLFRSGLWEETRRPVEILGSGRSGADGAFEILGLPSGRVFVDGRSDRIFVRTPAAVRLARGEIRDGLELRGSPGGRVRGVVLGADGAPASGAVVDLRPGLNAFLGQMTERKYRWLETLADEEGRFDLPGVPTGTGYTISASSTTTALEEQHGLEVREGQVTDVLIRGHAGGTVAGRVLDADGAVIAGANVAMVYLDVSRVLFSADGRDEPVVTDDLGLFRVERVAAGRVAFVAAADGLAPSHIEELAVVDGGVYDDLELRLGEGASLAGLVVDEAEQPLAGATVEVRPIERPRDSQFLKMMLKIRRIDAKTGADGRFVAAGLTGDRVMLQVSKSGYTTAIRSGVKLDEPDLRIQVFRGVTVHGRVALADGTPVSRFSVDASSRPVPAPDEKSGEQSGGDENDPGERRRGGRGGWGRGGGGWGRGMRDRTRQLPAGQTMADRGMEGNWREFGTANGTFRITGVPPGKVRIRVRAEGYLDTERQEVVLESGQESEELQFALEPGIVARGVVVDAVSGTPVSDAQVAAYRSRDREGRRGGGMFQMNVDPEDFDFLGLRGMDGRRGSVTNTRGEFEIIGLRPGKFRFTARHPDMAKASAKDVEIVAGQPAGGIEIQLDTGGGVEGNVTGIGMRPLQDAMIVAFSISAGSMKSANTDRQGYYRIDGLPPGQYIVFKSRMDERSDNLGLDLMSNMRLKTVTVRKGRFKRLDIHDEGEDGVRVWGVVREGGEAVPRALVTALGTDREGIFGMGVRAIAADREGNYELVGIKPGSYLFQVSRFQGRPMQTTISVDVPYDVHEYRFDLDLPQSDVAGRVIDSNGEPVSGVQVALGMESGDLADADGLLGLIVKNGMSRARTEEDGSFRIRSVAAGTYRLTVGSGRGGRGRGGRGRGGAGSNRGKYGEAVLDQVLVDGVTAVEGLQVVLPLAGSITGQVVDGSGNPVAGAEIHYADQDRNTRRRSANPLNDLLGMQQRPVRTGADGRFEIGGVTPGTYSVRADADGLETGSANDVLVYEAQPTDVSLTVVRGATIRLRVTNVDRQQIPLGDITLLDGNDKPVVRQMSTVSIMRRLMGNRQKVDDSGWHEFGSVPPDTYTIVVRQQGKEEIRLTRTVADGEVLEWDVDLEAELNSRNRQGK